jgi:hypothetical protein
MKFIRIGYFVILFGAVIALIFVHGWEESTKFKVDNTTVLLLTFLFLPLIILSAPYLRESFKSIKIGGMEAQFNELDTSDKEVFLINELAKEDKWTYYAPRENENYSGKALLRLCEKLKNEHHDKFIQMLTKQIDSNVENLIWFASENIGYFKLEELKKQLNKHGNPKYLNFKAENIAPEKLSCLWSLSRFNNYKELTDNLKAEHNSYNNDWIAEALNQMLEQHCTDYRNAKDNATAKVEQAQIKIINDKLVSVVGKDIISQHIEDHFQSIKKTFDIPTILNA